jgi:aspartate aminotransferase
VVERYRPIRFSRAGVRGLKASATIAINAIAINERVREMWAAGQNIYHLAFGESRFPVHPKIAEAFTANVQKRSYQPPLGIPELRRAVAEHYQRKFDLDVTPEQVVIGPGSKSLIFASLLALGEEVIIPQPSWVSYGPSPHQAGGELRVGVGCPRGQDRGVSPELGQSRGLRREQPQEPHGDHDAPREGGGAGAIRAGTRANGGGWRVGTGVLPPGKGGKALAHAIANIASNIWTCVTAPVQYAALVAYSGDPEVEDYVDLCAQMHAIRTRFLYQTMVRLGIPSVEPAGAFYVFPSFERWKEQLAARGVHTDEDLAFHLMDRYEIAALPGSAFALPGSAFHSAQDLCLRISSSYIDAATNERAEALVAAFQEDPDPGRFIENHHPRLRAVASSSRTSRRSLGTPSAAPTWLLGSQGCGAGIGCEASLFIVVIRAVGSFLQTPPSREVAP